MSRWPTARSWGGLLAPGRRLLAFFFRRTVEIEQNLLGIQIVSKLHGGASKQRSVGNQSTFLRAEEEGILSISRYLATVRLATFIPSAFRRVTNF